MEPQLSTQSHKFPQTIYLLQILMLNPMAQIIQDLRYILTFSNNTNPTLWQLWDHSWVIILPYLIPIFVFAFGYWFFMKHANKFAEII